MLMKKRGLGKSLEELMRGSSELASAVPEIPKDQLRKLPLDYLQKGRFQPRRDMFPEALEELAESIKAQGVIQPIVVREISDNRYEIVAGERRWRASQLAGLDEIPAIIRDLTDDAAMAIGLIENIQREDLNPLEEARALQRLITEFGMTHQGLAESIGKRSRAAISNYLRLLSLNPDVQILVEHGDLEMGHARALLALKEEVQLQAAKMVVAKELSVRETERLVKRFLSDKKLPEKTVDPDIRNLQDELSQKLCAKVTIQHFGKGKGKLVIKYSSLDELEGILEHIK